MAGGWPWLRNRKHLSESAPVERRNRSLTQNAGSRCHRAQGAFMFFSSSRGRRPLRAAGRVLATYLLLSPSLLFAGSDLPENKGYLTPSATGEGFHFSHKDWEIACDNTRTCRAAGYHQQDQDLKVSVLLSRAAGPGTRVVGELKIGQYGEDPVVDKLPPEFALSMQINGEGVAIIQVKDLHAHLSTNVVNTLLKTLVRDSRIEFVHGGNRWHLSDRGASAVLLKMDAFQGRMGTPGALVRPGTRSEGRVRSAVATPVVQAPRLPPSQPGDDTFTTRHGPALLAALRESGNCSALADTGSSTPLLEATRLSETRMLVSTLCWLGAYNTSSASWIVQTTPPFQPQRVNDQASDVSGGSMSARQKGRGLGDCWSFDDWTWNGEAFAHTHSSTTGMCRLMEPGGAWKLPVWITRIEQPSHDRRLR